MGGGFDSRQAAHIFLSTIFPIERNCTFFSTACVHLLRRALGTCCVLAPAQAFQLEGSVPTPRASCHRRRRRISEHQTERTRLPCFFDLRQPTNEDERGDRRSKCYKHSCLGGCEPAAPICRQINERHVRGRGCWWGAGGVGKGWHLANVCQLTTQLAGRRVCVARG